MSMTSMTADLPSWLQSFAAIVALFIAVWGTLRADKAIKRRERLQARCIATAIFPDFLVIEVCVERSRKFLETLTATAENYVGQSVSASVQGVQIELPAMLMRNVDSLYMLGEPAGPTCLQLVSVVLQYNDLVQTAAAQIATMNKGEWADHLGALGGHLKAIQILITQAQAEVAPAHDPK